MLLNLRPLLVIAVVQSFGVAPLVSYSLPASGAALSVTAKSTNVNDGEISQDLATIARIKKRIALDMRNQNANDVVKDMALLAAAKQKLERDDEVEKAEANIALIRIDIKNDMKAGQAEAVVADMQRLQAASERLQMLRQTNGPIGPAIGQPYRFGYPAGVPNRPLNIFGLRATGAVPSPGTEFKPLVKPLPHRQYRHFAALAAKPVEYDSVLDLSSQLRRYAADPQKLMGMLVTTDLKTDANGNEVITGSRGVEGKLTKQARLTLLSIQRQITMHYRAIRVEARERQAAEHRYQLILQEQRFPGAAEWEVPPNISRAESIEAGKIIRAANRAVRRDLRRLAIATKAPENRAVLVTADGRVVKKNGAVFGVVIGILSRKVVQQTPQFTLPSGPAFRSRHILGWMPQATSRPGPGYFLGQVGTATIPAAALPSPTQYKVEILSCGRAPHYRQNAKKRTLKPIKGYVFHLANGKEIRADTYTTGPSEYQCEWNGVTIPILKRMFHQSLMLRRAV